MSLLARRAVGTAVLAGGGLVGLWLFFIRSRYGQRLDTEIREGRILDSGTIRAFENDALHLITLAVLALALLAVVAVAVRQRRPAVGAVAAGSVAAAVASAELLKRFLDRPDLVAATKDLAGNSFPSGHATIATGVALAAVLLATERRRALVATIGAAGAAFVAAGVLGSGWHRPSDAAAGVLLALVWAALGLVLLVRVRQVEPVVAARDEALAPRLTGAAVVALLPLLAGVLVHGDELVSLDELRFLVASAVLVALAASTVGWYHRLLRGWRAGRDDRAPSAAGRAAGSDRQVGSPG